jgi:methyl-accepting chemotaxis protein
MNQKNTVEKIKVFTEKINNSVEETTNIASTTLSTTSQQENAIKNIVRSIEYIAALAEDLKQLAEEK